VHPLCLQQFYHLLDYWLLIIFYLEKISLI